MRDPRALRALYRDRAVRTVRHQPRDRLQTSGALRCTRFGGLAGSGAATGRTTRRSAPTKRSRHSFSRSAGQGELWFTDEDAQPAAAASEPVFWTEPTRPDDQSHPPAAADPTDRAADTAQAASRLTTCQPKHTSLPEKTLKTLF